MGEYIEGIANWLLTFFEIQGEGAEARIGFSILILYIIKNNYCLSYCVFIKTKPTRKIMWSVLEHNNQFRSPVQSVLLIFLLKQQVISLEILEITEYYIIKY